MFLACDMSRDEEEIAPYPAEQRVLSQLFGKLQKHLSLILVDLNFTKYNGSKQPEKS